jgi:hypothetical protein
MLTGLEVAIGTGAFVPSHVESSTVMNPAVKVLLPKKLTFHVPPLMTERPNGVVANPMILPSVVRLYWDWAMRLKVSVIVK